MTIKEKMLIKLGLCIKCYKPINNLVICPKCYYDEYYQGRMNLLEFKTELDLKGASDWKINKDLNLLFLKIEVTKKQAKDIQYLATLLDTQPIIHYERGIMLIIFRYDNTMKLDKITKWRL